TITTISNSSSHAFSGDYTESFDASKVLVQAKDGDGSGRVPGLYLADLTGDTTTIMDAETPIPDGDGNFGASELPSPRTSDGILVFATMSSAAFNDAFRLYAGTSQESLLHIASLDSLDLGNVSAISVDGPKLAFLGRDR